MFQTATEGDLLVQRVLRLTSIARPCSYLDLVALTIFATFAIVHCSNGTLWNVPDQYQHLLFERPQLEGGSGQWQKGSSDIAKKLEEEGKDCVVFWGSQSGTAEGLATRLAKELQSRFGLPSLAIDLSDYEPHSIALIPSNKLVVFILSTYGEGDPSDNATQFYNWVVKENDTQLANIQYSAFGLGNSNYKHYNHVVDNVTCKLDAMGAVNLLATGRGDEAKQSTEESFMGWKEQLFRYLKHERHLEEQSTKYEPALCVTEDSSLDPTNLYTSITSHPRDNLRLARTCSEIKQLPIKHGRELFSESNRSCVHVEFDITDHHELQYKTGDHLAIWPIQPENEVEVLLEMTGFRTRMNTPLIINSVHKDSVMKVPTPVTVSSLFRTYLEISAPLPRDILLGLAQFAPTEHAKAYVLSMGKDRDLYSSLLSHSQITLGRFLRLASDNITWNNLPLAFLIENLPATKPRYYSISSSSVISPRRIAVTALVTIDSLPVLAVGSDAPAKIHGVTTNYLSSMKDSLNPSSSHRVARPRYNILDQCVTAHVRKSKFKLPFHKGTPIIMIAAGTGLAPFRAFVSERAKQAQNAGLENIGQMILFFGCRNPSEDWIYREEMENSQKTLEDKLKIVTAFSRVPDQRKLYVQDRIKETGNEVVELLEQKGASLFICGRTSMAKDVAKTIVAAAKTWLGLEEEQSWAWVEALKRQGKWKEDVWG